MRVKAIIASVVINIGLISGCAVHAPVRVAADFDNGHLIGKIIAVDSSCINLSDGSVMYDSGKGDMYGIGDSCSDAITDYKHSQYALETNKTI